MIEDPQKTGDHLYVEEEKFSSKNKGSLKLGQQVDASCSGLTGWQSVFIRTELMIIFIYYDIICLHLYGGRVHYCNSIRVHTVSWSDEGNSLQLFIPMSFVCTESFEVCTYGGNSYSVLVPLLTTFSSSCLRWPFPVCSNGYSMTSFYETGSLIPQILENTCCWPSWSWLISINIMMSNFIHLAI